MYWKVSNFISLSISIILTNVLLYRVFHLYGERICETLTIITYQSWATECILLNLILKISGEEIRSYALFLQTGKPDLEILHNFYVYTVSRIEPSFYSSRSWSFALSFCRAVVELDTVHRPERILNRTTLMNNYSESHLWFMVVRDALPSVPALASISFFQV